MDRYAVFGNAIAHSRSPFIHNFFAEETGEDISYEKILAPLDGFPDAVRKFFSEGGRGCNVTVPFKEEAFAMCESLSPRAEAAGAVNTLIFRDGVISGDNTDGAGFIADLKSQGVRIEGARVLLIGAGGASRGILFPLEAERPASLFIANRTVSKAEALAAKCSSVPMSAGTPADAAGTYDLVINATSSSLQGKLPGVPDSALRGAFAYDLMYGADPTVFLRHAEECGARGVSDGLGMLVMQAAESFFDWRGVRPDASRLTGLLREALAKEQGGAR